MTDPRLGRVTVTVAGREHVFESAYGTWSEDNCLLVTDGHGDFLAAYSATGWQSCSVSYASSVEVDNEA